MIRLEEVKRDPAGNLNATYVGEHRTPGRDGTTLEFKLRVQRRANGKVTAEIDFDGCEAETPTAALCRLGEWCRRASVALDEIDSDSSGFFPIGDDE